MLDGKAWVFGWLPGMFGLVFDELTSLEDFLWGFVGVGFNEVLGK